MQDLNNLGEVLDIVWNFGSNIDIYNSIFWFFSKKKKNNLLLIKLDKGKKSQCGVDICQ